MSKFDNDHDDEERWGPACTPKQNVFKPRPHDQTQSTCNWCDGTGMSNGANGKTVCINCNGRGNLQSALTPPKPDEPKKNDADKAYERIQQTTQLNKEIKAMGPSHELRGQSSECDCGRRKNEIHSRICAVNCKPSPSEPTHRYCSKCGKDERYEEFIAIDGCTSLRYKFKPSPSEQIIGTSWDGGKTMLWNEPSEPGTDADEIEMLKEQVNFLNVVRKSQGEMLGKLHREKRDLTAKLAESEKCKEFYQSSRENWIRDQEKLQAQLAESEKRFKVVGDEALECNGKLLIENERLRETKSALSEQILPLTIERDLMRAALQDIAKLKVPLRKFTPKELAVYVAEECQRIASEALKSQAGEGEANG